MSTRNPRPERDETVAGESVVPEQSAAREIVRPEHTRTRNVPPREEHGENVGPDEPIRFDQNDDVVPPRETESPARAPIVATAMFLPVVILSVVALVLILWFLL
ncbi:MAG TPA: hypothetical protein VGR29_12115 [Thermomicrobiales bacterium]|nr:hypothetical protein [Thermomicrobiales bacterium]